MHLEAEILEKTALSIDSNILKNQWASSFFLRIKFELNVTYFPYPVAIYEVKLYEVKNRDFSVLPGISSLTFLVVKLQSSNF